MHPAPAQSAVRLDAEMLQALQSALQAIAQDPAARAIVLESSRETSWCEGMDLSSAREMNEPDQPEVNPKAKAALHRYAEILSTLFHNPLPVLAKVQGRVQGGGLGLLCACDRIFARDNLAISLPETLMGLTPAMVLPLLELRVGPKAARWLAMSGDPLSAAEAQGIGVVDELFSDLHALDKRLRAAVKSIRRRSPAAIAQIAQQIHDHQNGEDLAQKLAKGAQQTRQNLQNPAVQNAIAELLEGQLPHWGPTE